jgi:ribonucleoside-diphosphate reductase alpha chain
MTSNRDIPFAKSLIDYIFCWMGCQFIPGYAEKNTPNRTAAPAENKTVTTARQLVEKTKDLAHKIAEAKETKAETKTKPKLEIQEIPAKQHSAFLKGRLSDAANRIKTLVGLPASDTADSSAAIQLDASVMQQFNAQFEHFQDDAPACDICGSITVRNGNCYKCFNCGNSMGCS